MYKSIKSKVYLLIIFCVTACYPNSVGEPASLSPSPLETGIASTPVQNKTTIPTVDTVDIKPTATITPTPKTESSPITTPSQTNEPETELVNIGECPKQVASDTQPFWSTGSILFGTGQLLQFDYPYPYNPQSPGIWAVSSSNLEPQLAYGIPEDSSSWVIVSDDGNTLLRFEYTNEDRTEEEVIFYDLEGQTETRLQIVTEEAWDFEWLPDGQVKILTDVERIWGEGIKREFILLDLVSEQSEILIENLSLPGYIFNDEVIPGGFASISPSDNLVLYTALANDEVKVRLLDLITEDIIWEEESRVLPGPPPPVWTADGSRVLFYIGDRINEKRFGFDRIVNLGKDGQEVQLPFQPYPSTDDKINNILFTELRESKMAWAFCSILQLGKLGKFATQRRHFLTVSG